MLKLKTAKNGVASQMRRMVGMRDMVRIASRKGSGGGGGDPDGRLASN